jgi:soluble lytic murein transglycosylase-like protein
VIGTVAGAGLWLQAQGFNKALASTENSFYLRFQELSNHQVEFAPPCSVDDEELVYYKILSMKQWMRKNLAREIAASVVKYSKLNGKDSDLVLAVIAAESNFNPRAVSPTGALGLMQVMPFWKKDLRIECDLRTVDCNIRYGVDILKTYGTLYDDVEHSLAAYNRGPLAVLRDLKSGNQIGDYYTRRVLAFKDRLERLE